jgi:dienelactone hydrolase
MAEISWSSIRREGSVRGRVVFAVLAALGVCPVLAEGLTEANPGLLAVDSADDLVFHDVPRKRKVPYRVSFPAAGGPYPVIVFSHGFGGNKDAFAAVGRHWASHGYVVIHPSHADGQTRQSRAADTADQSALQRTRPGRLLQGLNDPERITDRVADIVLVIDCLDTLPEAVPALQGRVDAKRIGVGGHSFGAYTAMLIGGVTVDLGADEGRSFRDERVMCILPISGQGTGQQGLTGKSWAALALPMMTITGTRDRGAGGQGVDWKTEPYQLSPPGDKYLVVIDGANHFSFGGRLGARSAGVTDVVTVLSTHFWDAYLKHSKSSMQYLQSDRPAQESGGAYDFQRK